VREGKKRGRLLGFPTANVRLHKKIPEGIYVSEVVLASRKYMAATFIGSAKTFNETDYKAESYMLDFDEDIYGKWIKVRLFKKIRGNEKFVSEALLIKKMEEDVLATRNFFSEVSSSRDSLY
jgi:riboflavin kinase/FMN adenylyltransferase